MSAMTKRMVAVVGLAVMATAAAPVAASAGGARLYEMTENMKLTSGGKFQHRKATSELIGVADVGTPLCPAELVAVYAPGAKSCTINATGSDNINLGTGLGPVSGKYTVVVQGDNNADSPEFVIAKGIFNGKMDFSPAVLMGIPLGHVTGTITDLATWKMFPFTGTFRLPFVLNALPVPDGNGGTVKMPCGPALPCDLAAFGGAPTPLNPMDRYDLVAGTRPLYLLDDMASIVPVESSEFGGGWATVRFEINF
jgi:hypothetical protein